jgi:membrane associated rhomboid family serine protease
VYITLLTSMFIHGGFLHIASNMLYLWVFGDNVEDQLGHVTYLIFYVVCGIAAGLTHVLVNAGSTIPSVGASGAIAGVLGGYLLMFPGAQVRTLLFLGPIILFPRISAFILIGFWFITQLLSGVASLGMTSQQTSGVAFWAHIGGFVAGLLLALVLRPRQPSRSAAAW